MARPYVTVHAPHGVRRVRFDAPSEGAVFFSYHADTKWDSPILRMRIDSDGRWDVAATGRDWLFVRLGEGRIVPPREDAEAEAQEEEQEES